MNISLLFLLLTFGFSAQAVELRGDWESAGDMPMPYEPTYKFEYDCQLELKGKHPNIALTRFTLHNQQRSVQMDEGTRWAWVKLGGENGPTVLPRAPKSHGLQLTGHFVSLTLWPGEVPAKDSLRLNLGWKLDWKNVILRGKSYEFDFTRGDDRLRGDFFLYVSQKNYENLREIHGQIHCHKVK